MNQNKYEIFGTFLIFLTLSFCAVLLSVQLANVDQISRGNLFGYFYNFIVRGLAPAVAMFFFGFFPGLFYYRLQKSPVKKDQYLKCAFNLQSFSLIVFFIASLAFVVLYIYQLKLFGTNGNLTIIYVGTLSLITYFIGYTLLILHKLEKIKHKKK